MTKKFTLIEMIVSIVILAILASIVLVSLLNIKNKSIHNAMLQNTRILQTTVDEYYLKNETYPIKNTEKLTLAEPQLLDISLLEKESYLKKELDTSKIKQQYYWVDVFGKVWGATSKDVHSINVFKSESTNSMEFVIGENIQGYKVYEVNGYNTLANNHQETDKIASKEMIPEKKYKVIQEVDVKGNKSKVVNFDLPNSDSEYLVSVVDEYGLEVAPFGKFSSVDNIFEPIINKTGVYEFEITSENKMIWINFLYLAVTPGDSSVTFDFKVKDEKGNYKDWEKDYFSLENSTGIIVRVDMKGDDKGNKPSLYDLKVIFKYENEDLPKKPKPLVNNKPTNSLICPEAPMKSDFTRYKASTGTGNMVYSFHVKEGSMFNEFLAPKVDFAKGFSYELNDTKYMVALDDANYVEYTEDMNVMGKCMVVIYNVTVTIIPPEHVIKELCEASSDCEEDSCPEGNCSGRIVCGQGGSGNTFDGKKGKRVFQYSLDTNQKISKLDIKNYYKGFKITNIYLEYSADGAPYVVTTSIHDIPAGSCFNVVYEIELLPVECKGDCTVVTDPEIELCKDKECPELCKENCGVKNECKGKECDTPKESCEDTCLSAPPITPNPNDKELNDPEWTTIERVRFFGNGVEGQSTRWIHVTHDQDVVDKTNTRVIYRYAKSNKYRWSNEYDDFQKTGVARSVMAVGYIQVRTKELTKVPEANYPVITKIIFHHERGDIPISLIQPTLVIVPVKNNNEDREDISDASIIDWTYLATDPRNKEITDVEWAGDVRNQYPVGKYEVKARVKNEVHIWSEWVTMKFEVKQEKPIADFNLVGGKNFIISGKKVAFDISPSYDPDGDKIVNYEWKNKKDTYSEKEVGKITISLRVQDSEGHWSDWTEKEFTVTSIDEFWFIDNVPLSVTENVQSFDGDNSTHSSMVNKTLSWSKDISGRTMYVRLRTSTGGNNIPTTFSFEDENGNKLRTLTDKNNYVTEHTLITNQNSLGEIKMIVPEGAASVTFDSRAIRVFEISLNKEVEVPNISDLTTSSTQYTVSGNWTKPNEVDKTYFILGDEVVGHTSTNTITINPLLAGEEYEFKVISVDSNFNTSKATTMKVTTKEADVTFFGADIEAFDKDETSYVEYTGGTITWDKDIAGETMSITVVPTNRTTTYQTNFTFVDKNMNPIYSLSDNDKFLTTHQKGDSTNRKVTLKVIVPKGATGLVIGGTIIRLNDIHLINKGKKIQTVSNLKTTSTQYTTTTTWERPSEVAKTYLIHNNVVVGVSTGTSSTVKSLTPSTEYNYTVISVDSNFNSAPAVQTSVITEAADVIFYGAEIQAFDKDLSSYVEYTGGTITWDRDITGETMNVTLVPTGRSSSSSATFTFIDSNGNDIPSLSDNNVFRTSHSESNYSYRQSTIKMIVPEGAAGLKLGGTIVRLNDIHLINKGKKINSVSDIVTTSTQNSIKTTWKKPTEVARTYLIHNNEVVGNSTGTTLTVNSLLPSTTYNYRIISVDANFNSSEVIHISETTQN